MRGKGSLNWYGHFSCGITPAYAGKSEDLFYAEVVEEDHPRLCGEKAVRHAINFPEHGITPAYAGKSFKFFRRGFSIWDHPRLCGEKSR